MRIRRFERTTNSIAALPKCSIKNSVGYDFYITKDIEVIPSLIFTN